MIIRAVPRKVLAAPERTAALAAIATAKRKHKHVGIRPKGNEEQNKKAAGILLAPGSYPGTGLSQALRRATEAWPDENSWEVIGSDSYAGFPDDSPYADAPGDGYFNDPYVYGEFGSVDEPGWMGGYPA